jgi:hypothetical protein
VGREAAGMAGTSSHFANFPRADGAKRDGVACDCGAALKQKFGLSDFYLDICLNI